MAVLSKVGSFSKSTTAAPVTQTITGVGFTPVALLLWSAGGTVDGTIRTQATGDCRTFIGIATSASSGQQFSAAATADTAGGGGRRISQRAALLVDAGGATVASQALLSAFTSDGFSLNWSVNSTAESQLIHYLAVGGSDVSAKVAFITTPTSSGSFPVTGIGFLPSALLTIGSITAGTTLDTAAGSFASRFGAGLSASNRWAVSMLSAQSAGSTASRWHRNDRVVHQVSTSASSGTASADLDLVSMDADGFTMSQNPPSASVNVGVLALKVPMVAAGSVVKPTGGAPASQVVSTGFVPASVIVVGDMDVNRANAYSSSGARFGISALTSAAATASVISIPPNPGAVAFGGLDQTVGALKIDNATPSLDASASGVTNTGGGFTLTWNPNDAVATEFFYFALGDIPQMLHPVIIGTPSNRWSRTQRRRREPHPIRRRR